jgi:hypothetical protein
MREQKTGYIDSLSMQDNEIIKLVKEVPNHRVKKKIGRKLHVQVP